MTDKTNYAGMTEAELDAEFDRWADAKDEAQGHLEAIRAEKHRRTDEEVKRLKAELKAQGKL